MIFVSEWDATYFQNSSTQRCHFLCKFDLDPDEDPLMNWY